MRSHRDLRPPGLAPPGADLPGLAADGSYLSTSSVSETLDGEGPGSEPYSIRIPIDGYEVSCARCRTVFRAEGPTGFGAIGPVCDLCLLQESHGLGMMIALASVARAFGRSLVSDLEERQEALEELWAFTKIYETVAARFGPPRFFSFWRWGGESSE